MRLFAHIFISIFVFWHYEYFRIKKHIKPFRIMQRSKVNCGGSGGISSERVIESIVRVGTFKGASRKKMNEEH